MGFPPSVVSASPEPSTGPHGLCRSTVCCPSAQGAASAPSLCFGTESSRLNSAQVCVCCSWWSSSRLGSRNPLCILSLSLSTPATWLSVDLSLPISLPRNGQEMMVCAGSGPCVVGEGRAPSFSWLAELQDAAQLDLTHFSFEPN